MLIKPADEKSGDLALLQTFECRDDISADQRRRISQEIHTIRSGRKGESEAAYEMDFHFGASKSWMIIHDLRLECEGRVAQIDHLLMNRWLEIYVCESKRFADGLSINEHGEFSAYYGSKPYGVPSPIEQNDRHMAVLKAVFKTGQVEVPRRLGIPMMPSLNGLVLVSRNAHIRRPKAKVVGIDSVIKNDQIKARIWKDIDASNNPLLIARLIGQDTLEQFARRLAAAHKPISFAWHARFGLAPETVPLTPSVVPAQVDPSASVAAAEIQAEGTAQAEFKKSKSVCVSCGVSLSYAVAKFCWTNKRRFGGNAYCMNCQKNIVAALAKFKN